MMMRKILTVVLCAGMLAPLALHAENDKQPGKKAQKTHSKVFKQQAKAQRRENRANVRSPVGRNRGVRARVNPIADARVRAGTNRNGNRTTVVTRRNGIRNFGTNRNAVRNIERRRNTNRNVTVRRRGPANYAWSYNEAPATASPGATS